MPRGEYPARRSPGTTILGADAGANRGLGGVGGIAKTVALFALFALPIGIAISRHKAREQVEAEKAEFRRIGFDWEKRY